MVSATASPLSFIVVVVPSYPLFSQIMRVQNHKRLKLVIFPLSLSLSLKSSNYFLLGLTNTWKKPNSFYIDKKNPHITSYEWINFLRSWSWLWVGWCSRPTLPPIIRCVTFQAPTPRTLRLFPLFFFLFLYFFLFKL